MEKVKNKRRWFLGWNNVKWFFSEIMKIYSTEDSYFSKKRIESGIAFLVGQFGMVYFLINNINDMSSSDLAIWSGIEFAIAGYMVSHIQKEKGNPNKPPEDSGPGLLND